MFLEFRRSIKKVQLNIFLINLDMFNQRKLSTVSALNSVFSKNLHFLTESIFDTRVLGKEKRTQYHAIIASGAKLEVLKCD